MNSWSRRRCSTVFLFLFSMTISILILMTILIPFPMKITILNPMPVPMPAPMLIPMTITIPPPLCPSLFPTLFSSLFSSLNLSLGSVFLIYFTFAKLCLQPTTVKGTSFLCDETKRSWTLKIFFGSLPKNVSFEWNGVSSKDLI